MHGLRLTSTQRGGSYPLEMLSNRLGAPFGDGDCVPALSGSKRGSGAQTE